MQISVQHGLRGQNDGEKSEPVMAEKRDQSKEKEERGFAAMDKDKQREIARMGGAASHGGRGSQGSERGFAAMDDEQQREIARKGGQAAHEKGTAHEFTDSLFVAARFTCRDHSIGPSRRLATLPVVVQMLYE